MKIYINYIKAIWIVFLGLSVHQYSVAQCVTPVITSIGNSGPVCEGGALTLSATGTVGGVSSSFVRMAGIGSNFGNREFDELFASGDRAGSIERIDAATFNVLAAGGAASLRERYDVLLFTWATTTSLNAPWPLIEAYLALGGSVFWEDEQNISDLAPGVVGNQYDGSYGCGYVLVSPAPFPALVANGINGCFVNHHLRVTGWPSWMQVYIKGGSGENLAIAGVHPAGGGRLIVQGPDQDYHADHDATGGAGENQYKILLNQLDFLIAEQTGISWTGPNGFTSNEASPIISNVTAANAGVYTATLTNVTGGGCSTSATTTVSVIEAPAASVTPSGSTNICPGNTVTLTANEGIAYLWSTGATTRSISVGAAGSYSVQVTNANTCSSTSPSVTVNVNTSYCNSAPVAMAKPLRISADNSCEASAAAAGFDNGSTDADGDELTFTVSPAGPYPLGVTDVVLTVTDTEGASSSANTTVTVVDDTDPVLSLPLNITVRNDPGTCGAVVSFSPTATDNCSAAMVTADVASGSAFPEGVTTVNVTATDAVGNTATGSFTVTVTNAAPVLSLITPSPAAPVQVNTAFSASASFTDDNLGSASWNWGDGTLPSAGSISGTIVTGNHTYTTPGVYTVSLTVTDACGEAATSVYQYAVVYDPSGGFVTGGGWITSPAGAYAADPSLSGKASFGFVSKYKKGATVPDGQTQFQFHAAGFNFHSTVYEWLVVSGLKAQYKGSGTVNGTGDYGFMLSSVDGQVTGGGGTDKFRIKVWDKSIGDLDGDGDEDEAIVYDNQMGGADDAEATTALGGGSIVIHTGTKTSSTRSLVAAGTVVPEKLEGSFYSYPTAFSDRATVAFSLIREESYVLEIFDMKGALVRRLASGLGEASTLYEFELSSEGMREGIYITRLTTSSTVQSLKVVLKR